MATAAIGRTTDLARKPLVEILDNKNVLSVLCMLPAAILLLTFLTYPLGLGIWLGFTDTKIGREGVFIGLDNYFSLFDDSVFLLSVFNTILYTTIATVLKFGLGLYLALLLNNHLPFKALIRAAVLIPLIAANVWRGIPFVAICLLAGLQTISPSLYEAAALDGATPWQRFRHVTMPMLMPILSIVLTFSVLFTFTDFQLIYAITRGGPVNSTHLMATLAFQRAIPGGQLGEGAAIATAMIPFLVAATLSSYFGLQRRKWQQGESDD